MAFHTGLRCKQWLRFYFTSRSISFHQFTQVRSGGSSLLPTLPRAYNMSFLCQNPSISFSSLDALHFQLSLSFSLLFNRTPHLEDFDRYTFNQPMSCLHLLTHLYTHSQRCKHIRIYLSQNQWKLCTPMSSFNINKIPGYNVTHPFSGLLISLSPINTVHIWLFWRQPKNGIIEQNYINHAKLRHGKPAPCSTKYQCRKLILDISSTRLYYK